MREKNDLQDANTKLDVELKDVRGQLPDSTKENQRLRRGIFSKCLSESLKEKGSARKSTNRVMSVGMLTGRPAEEMPGYTGDVLPELSQLHERVRKRCEALPKPYGLPTPCPRALESFRRSLRELGGASGCGRYRPAGKVRGRPGPW